MKRIIYCTFLKKKSEGQKNQIYPGSIGKKIYNEISQKAWTQWQLKQTILINEKQLNMSKKSDQKKLEKYMKLFLFK